ncbi:hypothetical protein Ocin01_17966, partial [Orchesella cincta]
ASKQEVPDGLIFLGATSSKELYITAPEVTGDFTHSLAVGCPLRFQMSLAAVESTDEVELINSYFDSTQGNSSDAAWTSAMARVGLIPAHWASNGLRITEFPAPVQGPWPPGAGSSPTYASYNCVTIQRVCVRPPHTPIPGCFQHKLSSTTALVTFSEGIFARKIFKFLTAIFYATKL